MTQSVKHLYEFGPFCIDVTERTLLRSGSPVALTPKAFDTLMVLVQNCGHTLEKDDLMKTVWPDTIVEENNLTQNVSALRKVLGKDSTDRPYIETIPRRGYRFIAPVKERWEEMPQLIVREHTKSTVIIEEEETDAPSGSEVSLQVVAQDALATRPHRNLNLLYGAAGVALVALMFATVYYRKLAEGESRGNQSSARGMVPAKGRRSVAVLGLKNLSGRVEAAWLSTALSEMLTTELAAGDELRAIPGENIARMKMELPLADTDSLATDTLTRIRRDLGTDYVVLGSYTALGKESGGKLRLDLRLQNAAAGGIIAAVAETGTEADLFDLVSRAGARLRDKLGAGNVPAGDAGIVRAALPTNPEAAKLYAEGLAKLRVFDALEARDLLQKAVAAEPQYPLAHSALAAAWSALGYDSRAREEAKRALDLSANLANEQKLLIEARYREMTNEWDKAAQTYRALFNSFPDNVDYGFRLAMAQVFAGHSAGQDADSTIVTLRKLAPPAADDPRIDLAEAALAESRSNFNQQRAAASRAAEKGASQGAELLVASARQSEGAALWRLGHSQEAMAAFGEAQRIFASAGDQDGLARALHATAEVLADQGDLAAAKAKYEEALAIWRRIGNQGGVAATLNDIASVLWMRSDLAGARQLYDEALPTFREIGDKRGTANVLNNIANVLYNQGQLGGARDMYEEALTTFRGIGDEGGEAQELTNIGLVLYNQGSLSDAKSRYEEALAKCNETGAKSNSAYVLYGLGQIAAASGDLAGAHKWHQQALAVRNALGEKASVSESQLDLAALSIEEGRAAEGEAAAREAAEEFRREEQADDEAYADDVLARALLAQNKTAEAQKAIDRGAHLAEKSRNLGARLAVSITAARVQSASAPRSEREAVKSLETTLAQARKLGFFNYQLEARLALGEIELKSGSAAARADLQSLQKEAEASGHGLIARKAARAMQP